jgi:DNA-binding transcriptional regulator YhcF (GntR family)
MCECIVMTLRLHVLPDAGEPPYRQLVRQLKKSLASGSLEPGEQMPAVRILARDLRLSPNTVARAYRELEREGLLAARAGGGTRVNTAAPAVGDGSRRERAWQRRARLRPLADKLVTEGRRLGLSSSDIRGVVFAAVAERRGQ